MSLLHSRIGLIAAKRSICGIALVFFLVLSSAATARADLTTLYDPGLGTLPGDQGWFSVVVPPASESLNDGLLNLDTTADRSNQAGYFSEFPLDGSLQHPMMPTLDRQQGYRFSFGLQVVEENHDARDDNGDGLDDRAGFSVIAISEDLLGLELGFFENRIWAYAAAGEGTDSRFTQAEGVDFDTTAGMVSYELFVQGDGYQLFADGSEILNGSLRNYNPSGLSGLIDPYDNPSFLFFGDDTTSADSSVLLGTIGIQSVPEPSTCGLLFAAAGLLAWRRFSTNRQRTSKAIA